MTTVCTTCYLLKTLEGFFTFVFQVYFEICLKWFEVFNVEGLAVIRSHYTCFYKTATLQPVPGPDSKSRYI